ncbi:MAG: DUF192 domain-containing protein [Planctomycetes bacterium]|nr:DUF192 domain-containing protein [Planctomycetota bacterium]
MQLLRLVCFALVAAALPLAGCEHSYAPYESRDHGRVLELGGKKVVVEIADKMATRRQGLMGRQSLPADHGMLFAYPSPRILGFWMRNTPLPLSIAFIEELPDGTGRIVNLHDMEPFVESPPYASDKPVRLALEMEQGWFARHGIKAGDTFPLPTWISELVPGEDSSG